jgi:uncharacterized protein (TIGR01777 family)
MGMAMKIVIPGGSGHVGQLLSRRFGSDGHEVVVLSRSGATQEHARVVQWDGRSKGAWIEEVDGAEIVINLAGRSVNCRYNKRNLTEMFRSRVQSTEVIGAAIGSARRPPRVWLQASTATIYSHTLGPAHDERGELGGDEPDVPKYWAFSVEIARAWERALADAMTPRTRKVALRTAILMGIGRGGAFDLLARLARIGVGGSLGGGQQFVSWIHEDDFFGALEFLIEREDLTGAVNVAAPIPLTQRQFMADLRNALGVRIGLPATSRMVAIGALVLRTDSELIMKSRRVVPGRLTGAGFAFKYPAWSEAAQELVARRRGG